MKRQSAVHQTALLNSAFDNINSATGSELNEIVNIIEQHGRKEKVKAFKSSNKIVAYQKAKRVLSIAK